jgi:hypothetical protein
MKPIYLKRSYRKLNRKYWYEKSTGHYPWKWFVIFMALFVIWALINNCVHKTPLVSPVVLNPVKNVYANEIRKEDTKSWKLYQLVRKYESNYGTMGLAVTCKNKGMINEVGYLPFKGFCFKSEGDQELTVMQWFQKRLNGGMSVETAMCLYNTGRLQKSCAYSIGNLSEAN